MSETRGTINFFETHIGAWEENVGDTSAILRRFRTILGRLRKRGFMVEPDPKVARDYPSISRGYYVGRKGNLEFHAHCMGRTFQIEFFQSINIENPNGGRYDFQKFALMPRTMQLACVVEMSHVLRKLFSLGYVLEGKRQGVTSANLLSVLRHAQGRTDEGDPLTSFNRRWNFESDWERGGRFERDESGWPSAKETRSWPSKNRDGLPIVSGEIMYCRHNGRLFRGVARPNMNSQWILISNGSCVYVSAGQLFRCEDPAAEPRRFVPGQLQRVRAETEKALKANAYDRVSVLARVAARMSGDAQRAA